MAASQKWIREILAGRQNLSEIESVPTCARRQVSEIANEESRQVLIRFFNRLLYHFYLGVKWYFRHDSAKVHLVLTIGAKPR